MRGKILQIRYLFLSIICLVLFAGCAPFKPDPRTNDTVLPSAVPKAYPSTPAENVGRLEHGKPVSLASKDEGWWKNFGNADLDKLITKSLQHNFDILTAWATLRQSEAATRKATAGLFPSINIDGDTRSYRTYSVEQTGDEPKDFVLDGYQLGGVASYELDLWGRITSQRKAELMRTEATAQDLQTAAMTVAATVADTWAALLGNRRDLEVLESQIAINEDLVKLQTVRFNNGIGTSLELLQQKELLASVLSEVPDLKQEASILRNKLAILQGTLPGMGMDIDEEASLPIVETIPEVGLPVEILDARPDIKAAWARLAAADWDVSAAHANRYPSLRISASVIYEAGNPTFLFSNWVASLVGALAMPLFDGGALAADEARAKATADIQVQNYAKTVAGAIEEVDNALANDVGEIVKLRRLEEQYAFASAAMIEARNSYLGGVSTFLNYITELKNVQSLERAIARQKTTVLRSRIALYRSLGSLTFPLSLK